MFREVMPELSQAAYVIAPDLPGFGESDVLHVAFVSCIRSSHLGAAGPALDRAAIHLSA
jgi:pimeloyl-ACP methyl ester carboxylesterase